MKQTDPYNSAFFDTVDRLDHVGEKVGHWISKGGWKLLVGIVTGICIMIFGTIQLLKAFGRGLAKAHQ